jgi:hypothetical protein
VPRHMGCGDGGWGLCSLANAPLHHTPARSLQHDCDHLGSARWHSPVVSPPSRGSGVPGGAAGPRAPTHTSLTSPAIGCAGGSPVCAQASPSPSTLTRPRAWFWTLHAPSSCGASPWPSTGRSSAGCRYGVAAPLAPTHTPPRTPALPSLVSGVRMKGHPSGALLVSPTLTSSFLTPPHALLTPRTAIPLVLACLSATAAPPLPPCCW